MTKPVLPNRCTAAHSCAKRQLQVCRGIVKTIVYDSSRDEVPICCVSVIKFGVLREEN